MNPSTFRNWEDKERPALLELSTCYSDLFGPKFRNLESPSLQETTNHSQIIRRGPIYALPNETLGAIFHKCRETITARKGSESSLVCVSHVSRRWRDVAVFSPFLWTRIHFGPRLQSPGFIQACLDRSRNCPLDLTFQCDDIFSDVSKNEINRCIDMVAPHACRWRSLDLQFHDYNLLVNCLYGLPVNAPVKHLRVILEHEKPGLISIPYKNFGTDELLSIELRGISFEVLSLSASKLTDLTLMQTVNMMSPKYFTKLLAEASFLTKLSIFGDVVSLGRNAWFSIHIPSLISLTLSPGSLTQFTNLCNALVTPALETLTLHHSMPEFIQAFTESLHRSSPKYPILRSLELRAVNQFPDATKSFLEEFPLITQLSLIAFDAKAHIPLLKVLQYKDPLAPTRVVSYPMAQLSQVEASMIFGGQRGLMEPLFSISAPNMAKSAESSVLLLPDLRCFGVTPLNEDIIEDVCEVLLNRTAVGKPISCIRSSNYDRISSESRQWLQERVSLGVI